VRVLVVVVGVVVVVVADATMFYSIV